MQLHAHTSHCTCDTVVESLGDAESVGLSGSCCSTAAERTDRCDATVMTTTNHYVAFPVSALRAAQDPRPPPLLSALSFSLRPAITDSDCGSAGQ